MWAHQKPLVIEYGSPGPSAWAWWSRWSALQASAEFWNAAAPNTRNSHRIGADAR